VEAIGEFTSVDPLSWQSLDQAKEAAMGMGIQEEKKAELTKINTIGEVIGFVFEEFVEEKLVQPTIVYDYPVETSPLAKKCDDPRFTQRFEMFAFGSELGNNYSELNDPIDLNERFIEEKKREQAGFEEAHQTDNDYLEAIEHGFPPTCGIAIGIDRMVMMITGASNIKEVIAFPTLRPKRLKQVKQETGRPVGVGKLASLGTISSEVKKAFPGISYAFTVVEGVEIKKESKELEDLKKKVVEEGRNVPLDQIRDISSIKAYREILKKTGIDVGSRRPSPEALLRRVVQGKGLYTINTAVDAYNVAVLETDIGLGGFDFDNIRPPVTLRFSKDGEEMTLLGESKVTKTKEGEIVYADSEKPVTLDLNYRDIDKTKITLSTKSVMLFADGGPGIDVNVVKSALELGAKYIQKFCGGEIKDIILVQ
jgi:DNA/RNA-binding domain of Phe-tRNA-synthetase-like protein